MIRNVLLLSAAVLMTGCAVQGKYHWGTYEPALYQYYKTPANISDFETELARTIAAAEERKQKVPPGLYAEYGHVLQVQGKLDQAATYYRRERDAWPESAVLMDTMLKSLQPRTAGKEGKP